jgi:sporulation protein YlmC with PRC-barrel domain
MALLAVLSILLAGGAAYGQSAYVPLTVINQNVYTADYLLGHQVYGSGNFELGQITDFIVDQSNGRIALLVLSDVPCFGNKKVAVPFGFLFKDQGGALKIDFPKDAPIAPPGTIGNEGSPCRYEAAMKPGVMSGAIDTAWVENVYRHYGYAPYWTEHGGTTMALYSCGSLVGSDVRIRQTEYGDKRMALTPCEISASSNVHASSDAHIGDMDMVAFVDDAVIDRDGHISYLILSDVRGRKDEFVAVPFSLVKGDAGGCRLEVSQDQLASGPRFNYDSHLGDRMYAGRVYSYYGVHPYWTEEGMVR